MPLSPGDQARVVAELTAQLDNLAELVPDGATAPEHLGLLAERLYAEMQARLSERWPVLPSPLSDELEQLLVVGTLAEALLLGYRTLADNEREWPMVWRNRFEQGLAAMAAGIDTAPGSQPSRGGVAWRSEPRQFTDAVLGRRLWRQ